MIQDFDITLLLLLPNAAFSRSVSDRLERFVGCCFCALSNFVVVHCQGRPRLTDLSITQKIEHRRVELFGFVDLR